MEKGEGRQGKSCPFSLRCYTAQGLKWGTEHPRPATTSSITQPIYWDYPTCNPSTDAAAAAKSLQSCPTLCDPRDGSPPGSPVPGILQARTMEWVAISFSNAGKWKVKVKSLSRVWLLATPWTAAYQALLPMGFSRQEYWSGLPFPSPNLSTAAAKSLQSCPTLCDPIDGSPPGSPIPGILQARILEWVAISLPVPKSVGLLWMPLLRTYSRSTDSDSLEDDAQEMAF